MLTLAEAQQQLNIESLSSVDIDELQTYVDSVAAVVERHTGEVVEQRTINQTYVLRHEQSLFLPHPVIELLSVVDADGADLDVALVSAKSGYAKASRPLTGSVTVTVEAGYTDVPANYNLAARIILQHLWRVQRGPSASAFSAGQPPEPGMGFAIPRRAQELLGSMLPGIA